MEAKINAKVRATIGDLIIQTIILTETIEECREKIKALEAKLAEYETDPPPK